MHRRHGDREIFSGIFFAIRENSHLDFRVVVAYSTDLSIDSRAMQMRLMETFGWHGR